MNGSRRAQLTRAEARTLAARLSPIRLFLRSLGEIPRGSALGRAALAVLLANAAIYVIALLRGLVLAQLVWFLFAQSLLQWLLTLRRLRRLQRARLEGFRLPPTLPAEKALPGLKLVVGIALVLAGGFAHLIYCLMLYALTTGWPAGSAGPAWLMLGILAAQSLLDHRQQIAEDRERPPLLAALFVAPFLTLAFVHGTILLGALLGAGALGTLGFLAIKTAFELAALDFERELAAVLRAAEATHDPRGSPP